MVRSEQPSKRTALFQAQDCIRNGKPQTQLVQSYRWLARLNVGRPNNAQCMETSKVPDIEG